ncbi:hypothetical protein MKW92_044873 [Papaver armeniacum]|nr:hypothetical protein MKW92_044873 [Papaver armeniacum]
MVILETPSLQNHDKLPMENNFLINEGPKHGINKEVPEIGMKFDSEELAYDYYNHYARNVGFSIRKDSTTHRKDKTISRRVLVCSNEGKYRQHPRGSPLKRRLHARTGCEAKLVIKLQSDDSK